MDIADTAPPTSVPVHRNSHESVGRLRVRAEVLRRSDRFRAANLRALQQARRIGHALAPGWPASPLWPDENPSRCMRRSAVDWWSPSFPPPKALASTFATV